MNQYEFLNKYSDMFTAQERKFLTEHALPDDLKAMLLDDFNLTIPKRREYENPDNSAILINILKWYTHHYNILECFKTSPYWNERKLALVFDAGIPVIPDFTKAQKLYNLYIIKPKNSYAMDGGSSSWNCETRASNRVWSVSNNLITLFQKFFTEVIGEGKEKFKKGVDINCNISMESVIKWKEEMKLNPLQGLGEDKKPFNQFNESFMGTFPPIEGSKIKVNKFADIARYLYALCYENRTVSETYSLLETYTEVLNQWLDLNYDLCIRSLKKELNVTAVNDNVTQKKYSLTVKALQLYNNLHMVLSLAELRKYNTENSEVVSNFLSQNNSFDKLVAYTNMHTIYCPEVVRERNESDNHHYSETHDVRPTQYESKLDVCMNGGFRKETLIISLHPCDLITSSLGNCWSSCHSYVTKFNSFMKEHGIDTDRLGSTYSGTYHRGNFDYLTGNALIAYKPYDIADPQFLVAKRKRCFMWLDESLTCLRQNCFYPGKPTDEESKAFALSIREIIQNVVASHNGTNGTQDWTSSSKSYSSVPFEETTINGFHGYTNDSSNLSDPAFIRSWVKKDEKVETRSILIGGSYVAWNCPTTFGRNSGINSGYSDHPDQGDHIFDVETSDGFVDYQTFLKKHDNFKFCYDTMKFEQQFIKVITDNNGSFRYYHSPDHQDIGKCMTCGNYYLKSLLINGRCLEHAIADKDANYTDDMIEQWIKGNIGLVIDSNVDNCLRLIAAKCNQNIKWKTGKNLDAYSPSKLIGKVMVISKGAVQICSPEFVNVQHIQTSEIK